MLLYVFSQPGILCISTIQKRFVLCFFGSFSQLGIFAYRIIFAARNFCTELIVAVMYYMIRMFFAAENSVRIDFRSSEILAELIVAVRYYMLRTFFAAENSISIVFAARKMCASATQYKCDLFCRGFRSRELCLSIYSIESIIIANRIISVHTGVLKILHRCRSITCVSSVYASPVSPSSTVLFRLSKSPIA